MESGLVNVDYGLLILSSLAVYRLSYMIAKEEGPISIFARIRGKIDSKQSTWVGRGINCPLCISAWLSLLPIIFILPRMDIYTTIVLWLSIAGLSMLLERVSIR